jgi:hypothetical protein
MEKLLSRQGVGFEQEDKLVRLRILKLYRTMSLASVSEIEQAIAALSIADQLLLIEKVERRLRGQDSSRNLLNTASSLSEMAEDPDIKRELLQIEQDFWVTELDGLAGEYSAS